MGPKKTGGKKKKKKGKKKEKIPEIPAEYYEGELLRLNHDLSDLRKSSNKEVIKFENLQARKDQLLVNRKEVDIYIDRTLEINRKKITEYETKITETQKLFQADREKAQVELEAVQANWTKWDKILESDCRILDGRLLQFHKEKEKLFDILWKQQIYRLKTKSQAATYVIQKYDKEREIIVLKYDLATEVEKRLYILALNYENTIDMRVSTYAKQLIRENIALNWEMDRLIHTNRRLQAASDDLDVKNVDCKLDLNITQIENSRLYKTLHRQERIILILSGKMMQNETYYSELLNLRNVYSTHRRYFDNDLPTNFKKLNEILDILNKYRELSIMDMDRLQLKNEYYQDQIKELKEYFKKLRQKIVFAVHCCAKCSKYNLLE